MKPKRRIISFLLAICLVAGLMPTAAFAADTDTGKAIQLVDSGTAANIGGGQADNIYYGTYQQRSAGSTPPSGTENVDWIKNGDTAIKNQGPYYYIDPIKWRVLSNADGKLFLLSDQNLDVFEYHKEYESVTWETSTMRSWLNGLAKNKGNGENAIDYADDNFLDTAFSAKDQAAIADTTVVNDDNPDYQTEGGNNTTDKVFLLSIAEAKNTSYFADDNSRIATNTAYVAGGGEIGTSGMYSVGDADYWWLRSPGNSGNYAADVYSDGGVGSRGGIVYDDGSAVRPAFNLNLNSVLFTSAAAGGKSSGAVGAGALKEIPDVTELDTAKDEDKTNDNDWKLTLLDNSRNFLVTETVAAGKSGDTITLDYTGATTGTNEYISVIIADNEGAKYYGRIAQPASANGTVDVKIPANLAEGNYTLKVFSEQYNGDYKTDYASAFTEVSLTVDNTAPPLDAPANLTWDSATPGKAIWNTVINASGYSVQLYKDGTARGNAVSVTDTTHTFTITEAGSYTFKVKAVGDGTNYADSPDSEASGKLHTVHFDTNGGSAVAMQLVTDGGKATAPTAPTKAGYSFGGWYADNAFATVYNFDNATISEATTIYAKWLSNDAGVTAVSVSGTKGTISGTNISVVLPYGSTPTTDSSKVSITPAENAKVTSGPSTDDGGTTWKFTVTAEDGTTTEVYTISVTVAEKPTAEIITKTEINEDFTDADIPQELKDAGYDTVAKIDSRLKTVITQLNSNIEGTALYDVILMYSEDGGTTWIKADETHFPKSGKLPVSLPVPEGTDVKTHDYIVSHMFTSSAFGKVPGNTEQPEVTERTGNDGKQYIDFYVTGLSPVMVAWENTVKDGSAGTGDDSDMLPWVIAAATAVMVGTGAAFGRRRETGK